MVDFSKAFNRQNHNRLITKLSYLGVPGWLLRIVMSFLKDRKIQVRYKGKTSKIKSMPGGGPQGTSTIYGDDWQDNNVGEIVTCKRKLRKANEIHLKFVDDLTLAESINLPEQLLKVNDKLVLPEKNSKIVKQLDQIRNQTNENQMKLNFKKTKIMVFNPCKSLDFKPEISLDGKELEIVNEIRLLGLIIRSDMKWNANTLNMVKKASKRLWILRRLKQLGASTHDLVDVYIKQVRCVLELAAPAWQGGISQAEKLDLERVKKCAAHIILEMCIFHTVMPLKS